MRTLDQLRQDLRHGLRLFLKTPGFTAVAVVSIAFGTGANVAMFSATDTLLLRPLPIQRPDGLITVGNPLTLGPLAGTATSYPDFLDIRERTRTLESLVAYSTDRTSIGVSAGQSPYIRLVTMVSGNFFADLGVPMRMGRGFRPDEDRVPGRDPVAVLSYGMWKQLLNADPDVLGRRIRIGGEPFTVIGVAAESFTGMYQRSITESVYVPMAMAAQVLHLPGVDPLKARDLRRTNVKGRLRSGTSMQAARADLRAIAADLRREHPDTNDGRDLVAQTELQSRITDRPLEAGMVLVLDLLAVSVLFVACANVAGLLTSRAPLRQRELAVRLAVGAGRGRLVTQLLTESLLIALAGGMGGLAVGLAGITLIGQIEFPTEFVAPPVFALDERALAFSLLLAMGCVLLFGLGPALTATRIDLSHSMRGTDPAGVRRWRPGGRSMLIAVQVALSLMLLTVATFAYRTFQISLGSGPGFRVTQMAKISVDASQAGYAGPRAVHLFEQLVARAREVPGVTSASVASVMPLFGFDLIPMVPQHSSLPAGHERITAFGNAVDERYFDTLEIPLLRGRTFTAADTADARPVAIINDTMARHLWPDVEAVGQRFLFNDERRQMVEIVGVVRTSLYLFPGEQPQDMVYLPFRQQPRGNMVLLAQTAGPSAAPLADMRRLVHEIDVRVPVYDSHTIETFYSALALRLSEIVLSMISGIGFMGLTITLVGLYALVSYAVNRRTREIGIRMAIGATSGRVLRMLLRQGLTPAWVGMVAGIPLSIGVGTALPSIVPTTDPYSAWVIVALVPVLLMVTLLAALLPARRASTANPVVALRQD